MKTASSPPEVRFPSPPSREPLSSFIDGTSALPKGKRSGTKFDRARYALFRFFWMPVRLEPSSRRAFGIGSPGWLEFCAARTFLADANRIRETGPGRRPATLLLYRAAANLLMRAHLTQEGSLPRGEISVAACWQLFRELPKGGRIVATLRQDFVEQVASCFESGESYIAGLSSRQRRVAVTALSRFAHAVARPLEKDASIMRNMLIQRWIRVGTAALLLLITMAVVLNSSFTSPNLALGHPVEAIVLDPQVTPNPGAVVDGSRTNLGVRAVGAPWPYVTIDLGQIRRVSRVVVYNRNDCCKEQSVPLGVELSQDLRAFHLLGHKRTPFDRWQLDFPTSDSRYVRITLGKQGTLQLSEVEVY